MLFNKDKTELLFYPSGKTSSEYVILSTVTKIGGFSFLNPTALETIEFSSGVTVIEEKNI